MQSAEDTERSKGSYANKSRSIDGNTLKCVGISDIP